MASVTGVAMNPANQNTAVNGSTNGSTNGVEKKADHEELQYLNLIKKIIETGEQLLVFNYLKP